MLIVSLDCCLRLGMQCGSDCLLRRRCRRDSVDLNMEMVSAPEMGHAVGDDGSAGGSIGGTGGPPAAARAGPPSGSVAACDGHSRSAPQMPWAPALAAATAPARGVSRGSADTVTWAPPPTTAAAAAATQPQPQEWLPAPTGAHTGSQALGSAVPQQPHTYSRNERQQ